MTFHFELIILIVKFLPKLRIIKLSGWLKEEGGRKRLSVRISPTNKN